MKRRAFVAGAFGAVFVGPIRAQGIVGADALSGDRFVADGVEYRLSDIVAPPQYALSDGNRAYFDQSKAMLQAFLQNGPLSLSDTAEADRWGTRVVIAQTVSGETAQHSLVRTGAARVAPQTDALELIDQLLALETEARAKKRGLWRLDAYRLRNANDIEAARALIGAYHILEGRVQRAALTRGRAYLNFGDDYRTDFTASARSRLARRWANENLDLTALEGRRIRVRGFVESINGPSIELVHMRQIEPLHDALKSG